MATLAERFWSKVNKDGPVMRVELGPCWVWTAAKNARRYGAIGLGGHRGRIALAPRVSFFLTHERWPRYALHHCDNPSCVRPEHIYDGTLADNARDCVTRGRAVGNRKSRGELNGNAKLSDVARQQIRAQRASGMTFQNIATLHRVTKQAVMYVCKKGVA